MVVKASVKVAGVKLPERASWKRGLKFWSRSDAPAKRPLEVLVMDVATERKFSRVSL